MPKVDVLKEVKNYDGSVAVDSAKKPLTYRTVLVNALNYESQNRKLTPEQKVRAYQLSTQIMDSSMVDLKSEDIVMIKEGLSQGFGVLVYGQVVAELEK